MDKVLEKGILLFKNRTIFQALVLLGITAAAAALRFFQLGEWSFWGDELITVRRALNLSDTLSLSILSIGYTLQALGTDEWTARLAPALFGVLAIPIFYFLVRKIFGPFIAVATALLLAVSPWHLYWSQNSRFYTSLFLFYNIGLLSFYIGTKENSLRYLALSLVSFGLAFLERHIALFFLPVVAGHVLFLIFGPRETAFKFSPKAAGLLIIPGLIAAAFAAPDVWEKGVRFINAYDSYANNSPGWILAGSIYYIGVPTIVMGSLGLFTMYFQKHRAFVLLGLAASVPLAATTILSMFVYTANRYVFVSLIAWIILAGYGIVELVKKTQGGWRLLAAGSLIVLAATSMSDNVLYFMVQHGNRANWKAAVAYIEENREPGDRILSSSPVVLNFYFQEPTYNIRRIQQPKNQDPQERTWFVVDNITESYYPRAYKWVRNNARLMDVYDVTVTARQFKMMVYLYDPANP